jgi:hypothetical protein
VGSNPTGATTNEPPDIRWITNIQARQRVVAGVSSETTSSALYLVPSPSVAPLTGQVHG